MTVKKWFFDLKIHFHGLELYAGPEDYFVYRVSWVLFVDFLDQRIFYCIWSLHYKDPNQIPWKNFRIFY